MTSITTSPGSLLAEGTHTPAQLRPLAVGINKVGRRTEPTQVAEPNELLLDTNDVLIHRQYHCIVEVMPRPDMGYDYLLSAYPGATNATSLDADASMPLHPLDQVYLQPDTAFFIGSTSLSLRL